MYLEHSHYSLQKVSHISKRLFWIIRQRDINSIKPQTGGNFCSSLVCRSNLLFFLKKKKNELLLGWSIFLIK